MSVKHLVFLVHGIGAHKAGWSDGFRTRLIEKATKRFKELYWGGNLRLWNVLMWRVPWSLFE